jgi:hypothetical protein
MLERVNRYQVAGFLSPDRRISARVVKRELDKFVAEATEADNTVLKIEIHCSERGFV